MNYQSLSKIAIETGAEGRPSLPAVSPVFFFSLLRQIMNVVGGGAMTLLKQEKIFPISS